jgi:hypothetical protein
MSLPATVAPAPPSNNVVLTNLRPVCHHTGRFAEISYSYGRAGRSVWGPLLLFPCDSVPREGRRPASHYSVARGAVRLLRGTPPFRRPGGPLCTSRTAPRRSHRCRNPPPLPSSWPRNGAPGLRSGMTVPPCSSHDPGGGVTGPEASVDR